LPYFDNNATTRASDDVVEAMIPFLGARFGNPSSLHARGEEAADAVRAARAQVARLLGCTSDEIVFTSGGTEANNLALHAALTAGSSRRTIVTCTTEHSSVLETCESLENQGLLLVRVPVDRGGRFDARAVAAELTDECALVSLMLANNETGVVNDLGEIARRCRELGIAFHADLVQAAGKLPLDVRSARLDLATISAHKIHGPKGVGALFVRHGFACPPLVFGGSQERRIRPGTENVPGIVGFGRAAENARRFVLDEAATARVRDLRDAFEREILARVPGTRVNGDTRHRVANTTSLRFAGLEAEALLLHFSAAGLFASAGSACHAKGRRPSHVLLAMGLTQEEAAGCVRFSLSRETTREEVAEALAVVTSATADLRGT
jgi:cysteine desulfurase